MYTNQRGYAALLATIVIAASLTTLAYSAAGSAYAARLAALKDEEKAQSRARAFSCVQAGVWMLAHDISYRPSPGGDAVELASREGCVIVLVEVLGDTARVVVRAQEHDVHTTIKAEFKVSDLPKPDEFLFTSLREI